ncbi:hypothetical protein VZT92_018499 [Zoarces viviparus]|uniref:SUEL-type lectin domain-containing protein n=1 Tax=Zoarces viviparus TaxID=48416 RepID=A0AAW1EJG9_ZOAVI
MDQDPQSHSGSDPVVSLSVSRCGNKRSCEVPVTELVFGEYPCKEQTRYLEVSYSCAPPPPPPPPTKPDCEEEPTDEV